MKTILLVGLAIAALPASSQATDKAPCAAKPFSLAKPAASPPKPVTQPVRKAAPPKVVSKPAKPLADCKNKPAAG